MIINGASSTTTQQEYNNLWVKYIHFKIYANIESEGLYHDDSDYRLIKSLANVLPATAFTITNNKYLTNLCLLEEN